MQVTVRDLVAKASLGLASDRLDLTVPCHGVRVLRLQPLRCANTSLLTAHFRSRRRSHTMRHLVFKALKRV